MIITNEPELRQPCLDASLFEAQYIIDSIAKELSESKIIGVGLAANQIGINKKVCVIRIDQYQLDLVNPVIVDKQDLCSFKNEGCLSFPGEWLSTKRYNEVFIKDLLHPAGVVCTGLTAVVVQHEVGHLYGETMYDYQITMPLGPNSLCWCGSGKKFKKCHTGKEIKV